MVIIIEVCNFIIVVIVFIFVIVYSKENVGDEL